MPAIATPAEAHACVGTLMVQRGGARLGIANGCFAVCVEGREIFRPPLHEIKRIVLIGRVEVTAPAVELAARQGVPIAFVGAGGQFRGLLAGGGAMEATGTQGERALAARREQWRLHLDPTAADDALAVARRMVCGKMENARGLLLRTGRRREDEDSPGEAERLADAATAVGRAAEGAAMCTEYNALLGHEGAAARAFFSVLGLLIVPGARAGFSFERRSRRPPRDPFNALISFLYGLLSAECASAVRAAGLEPGIGFLHRDRLGRPALALDLMEELRPAVVDRLALALVNRRQLGPDCFCNPNAEEADAEEEVADDGAADPRPAVHLSEAGRLVVLTAWRQRLGETVHHPIADRAIPWRLVPHLQAAHLADVLARGEGASYRPFCPRL